jgi:hypothetical protein
VEPLKHLAKRVISTAHFPLNQFQLLIQTLISDSNLHGRMGAVGRQLIIDKFTIDRVNDATMEVYRTVLQNAKKQTGEQHNR